MKSSKSLIILFPAFVLIFGASIFSGCSDDSGGSGDVPDDEGSTDVSVTGVTLNKASTSILVGGTEQLYATIEPGGATNQNVTWETDNESVATVSSDGLVTGEADGTATITVTTEDGSYAAECEVAVSTVAIPVTGVTLNKNNTSILTGNTEQLTPTISPAEATNQNVMWESSDETKAMVLPSGLVIGIAGGTAVIIVVTEDGDFFDECEVTVHAYAPGEKVTFSVGSMGFDMAYVPGRTFPTGTDDSGEATVTDAFWIGETEVTYELWSTVHTWATGNGYYFANTGTIGSSGSGSNQQPVTTVNWRDAMVWCNAVTEWYNAMKGTSYTCVYNYLGDVIRDSRDTNATACDNAMIGPAVTGFRLLSSNEWELAARWRDDSINTIDDYTDPYFTKGDSASGAYTYYNDDADTNPANGVVDGKDANDAVAVYGYYWDGDSWEPTGVSGTAEVKSKGTNGANALGLYDMSGNVYEWCFDWYPGYEGSNRVRRGGSWLNYASYLQLGNVEGGLTYDEHSRRGFRLARSGD